MTATPERAEKTIGYSKAGARDPRKAAEEREEMWARPPRAEKARVTRHERGLFLPLHYPHLGSSIAVV